MSHKIIEIIDFQNLKSKKGKKYAMCDINLYEADSGLIIDTGFVYIFNDDLLKKLKVGRFCPVFDVYVDYHAKLDCQLVDLLDEKDFSNLKNTLPRRELQILRCMEEVTPSEKVFIRALINYKEENRKRACNFTMFDDRDGNNILRDLQPGSYYAEFDMRVSRYGDNDGMLEAFISHISECPASAVKSNISNVHNTPAAKDNNKHSRNS